MLHKIFIKKIGFLPKENTSEIFQKKFSDGYSIEVDFENKKINFGNLIKSESKTTQNFSHLENLVVLECVNRLLEKGYKPRNIILEKTYPLGHNHSGRLDILVTRDDGTVYLMIECKTYGSEFDKAFSKLKKDGGQLFTYFQQDKNADILMLYASELSGNELVYRNEIIKIEDDYRQTGNVKDFYDRWNKLPKNNGVFDEWVNPYDFQSKALTPKTLRNIQQEDSSFIFNQFLEILRHNVVSDKPNAFNKIFTLFLCKIYDEKATKPNEELGFQWLEGKDNHISFQKRLTDLYKKGMKEFLEKEVTDISDEEFERKYGRDLSEETKKAILDVLVEIRLKKNNEFAIKEVFDNDSFEENAKVVKEVVELLQGFKIRYTKKQQYLSDFFELLLTTGLKQESGQFFTPVPIAQFIIKSIPVDKLVHQKLSQGEANSLLPTVIDYAAGSGHFITESMHEIQRIIDQTNPNEFIEATARKIKTWKEDHFDWAFHYVYGIEKDYRLVKVGKVGCYLHGDGLAKIIHSDGLGNFSQTKEYKDLLKTTDRDFPQENKQFDICISNPPYSVSAFKGTLKNVEISSPVYSNFVYENTTEKRQIFDLFKHFTDQSSEIECLFIERTKQLLKDGGIAGIILPSSILSNSGIYTRAREIILQYFDIVAIAEFGSNTFMATGTNTVTLFLRRRNNYDSVNIRASVVKAVVDAKDVTINGIEMPLSKYVAHVWEGISFADYASLLKKQPNEAIKTHEIYREYQKKINAKDTTEKLNKIIEIETEKLFYFILAYKQKIVLVKSGEKQEEKNFLGYEFSNRRGSEGIHPIQRGKAIDECTMLFDAEVFDNPEKASTYIYHAFNGDFDTPINEKLSKHISRQNLVDMFTFDRVDFEKNISLAVKKKIRFEDIWKISKLEYLGNISEILKGTSITKEKTLDGKIPVIAGGKEPAYFHNKSNRDGNIITISASGANAGFANYFEIPIFASDCNTVKSNNENQISTKLIFSFLQFLQPQIYELQRGQAQPHVYAEDLAKIKIPLPPKDIQEKIVAEIEVLEMKEVKAKVKLEKAIDERIKVIDAVNSPLVRLEEITTKIGSGATPLGGKGVYQSNGISFIRSQNIYDNTFVEKGLAFINEEQAKKLNIVTVEENDLLFNITGASVCRCCVVDKKYLPARVNQHVAIIRMNAKALPKYVQQILVSQKYKTELLTLADNSSTREAITKSQLEDFKIPLPPLSEQQKIVSQIEEIENKIAELESEIAKIPQEKEAILKKYL